MYDNTHGKEDALTKAVCRYYQPSLYDSHDMAAKRDDTASDQAENTDQTLLGNSTGNEATRPKTGPEAQNKIEGQELESAEEKRCKGCEQNKSVKSFSIQKYAKSGRPVYQSQCNPCRNATANAKRVKHPNPKYNKSYIDSTTGLEMKLCHKCKTPKTTDRFRKFRKVRRLGTVAEYLRSDCYECEQKQYKTPEGRAYKAAYAQKVYAANPERKREIARNHYHRHPEKMKDRNKRQKEKLKDYYLAYNKRRYAENKEEIKATVMAYYYEHKEERDAYSRRWVREHPERVRERQIKRRPQMNAYMKAKRAAMTSEERRAYDTRQYEGERRRGYRATWRAKNYDKAQAAKRRYYERHYNRVVQRNRIREALKLATQVEPIDRAFIIQRDNSTCYLCLTVLTDAQVTLEHVLPLSRGGSHTNHNLRPACQRCNSKKGTRLLCELNFAGFVKVDFTKIENFRIDVKYFLQAA